MFSVSGHHLKWHQIPFHISIISTKSLSQIFGITLLEFGRDKHVYGSHIINQTYASEKFKMSQFNAFISFLENSWTVRIEYAKL